MQGQTAQLDTLAATDPTPWLEGLGDLHIAVAITVVICIALCFMAWRASLVLLEKSEKGKTAAIVQGAAPDRREGKANGADPGGIEPTRRFATSDDLRDMYGHVDKEIGELGQELRRANEKLSDELGGLGQQLAGLASTQKAQGKQLDQLLALHLRGRGGE